ncbi:putative motility protein [Paenibacillus sp. GP183]|jgi:hypothetical protein|uniref:putative motility protein n=1 Tax=Paenibacillus sp. GP183 TaxID=1882751 RepID=UPI0008953DAE|nr:putative motility protein [Paenibacillus sp. GP183]SEB56085.1 Putative motility protein [Paenibacillus sp. GP183]
MQIGGLNAALTAANDSGLAQAVGIAVLSKTLDLSQQQGQQLVQMMSQSVQPNLVKHVDLRI